MPWLVVVFLAAEAPEHRRAFVDYVAPPDCPAATVFEQELTRRTDVVQLVPKPEASALVSVTLERKGKRYSGVALLRLDDGTVTRRALSGPKCDTLVQALALGAALVLDPEHAKTGPLDATDPPPPPAVEPPAVEPPAVEPPPVVDPAPGVTTAPPTVIEPPRLPESSPWSVVVFAEGAAANGVSNAFDFGGSARGQLQYGDRTRSLRFVGALGVGGLGGRVVESAVGRARYAPRFVAELEAGAALEWSSLRIGLTAAVRLEPLFVEGLDGDEVSSALRALVSMGPALSATAIVGHLELGARAMLPITLRRERYLIVPRGEVFAVPAVSLAIAVVAGWRFQ